MASIHCCIVKLILSCTIRLQCTELVQDKEGIIFINKQNQISFSQLIKNSKYCHHEWNHCFKSFTMVVRPLLSFTALQAVQ